ncbi:hypothetical protein AFLA_009971 [Aspergillus flavus NRRL3357]|nr:hypothetical protein AFLA_009971 [Aspergillus flavus NRRL3357]
MAYEETSSTPSFSQGLISFLAIEAGEECNRKRDHLDGSLIDKNGKVPMCPRIGSTIFAVCRSENTGPG